jgi:hypothetical protein
MPLKKQALMHTPMVEQQAPIPRLEGALAHPKILKRPAQFAGASMSDIVSPPVTVTLLPPSAAPAAPAPVALWSEDARFAVTLLAIIIVMNVVVSYWLSHIEPHRAMKPAATTSIAAPAITIVPAVVHPGPLGAKQVYVLDDLATAPSAPQ